MSNKSSLMTQERGQNAIEIADDLQSIELMKEYVWAVTNRADASYLQGVISGLHQHLECDEKGRYFTTLNSLAHS